VTNRTAFSQPLHIHGHVWQVIGAEDPAPLQDSAVILPGEMLPLAFKADNPGLWALHSLVAERSDGGLLTSFLVE
jgi:FtsP/CotA-like multicopper oxidase with cupredoxin domain